MASRIMHYALSAALAELRPCLNTERLSFGMVMPDAGNIKETHFLRNSEDGTMRFHDLSAFRKLYGDRMVYDDLYLGYYLHLMQDQIFRYYVFEEIGFDPLPPGNIDSLHNDYELMNPYVIGKYGLKNSLRLPAGIENEEISRTAGFDFAGFMKNFEEDFTRQPEGEIRFFTEEMTDVFIKRAYDLCEKEIRAVFEGAGFFREEEYAWHRHRW